MQRSDEIAAEKNRALKAALNAELRKTKATLLEQAIPLLEKMAKKGKGLTPEKIQARLAQVRGRCCARAMPTPQDAGAGTSCVLCGCAHCQNRAEGRAAACCTARLSTGLLDSPAWRTLCCCPAGRRAAAVG